MIYALMQFGYQMAVAALVVAIFLKGTAPMRRTILAVFAVMIASLVISDLWPTPPYAVGMIVADAIACLIVTRHPSGKWQSVIGLSFILQIGVHIGRLAGNNPDMDSYWWGLSGLAILQLLLVGGWWINDLVGFRFGHRWRGARPLPATARRAGVD